MSGIGSSRLDFEQRGLQEVVRASVSTYNSEGDIDVLVQALQALTKQGAVVVGSGAATAAASADRSDVADVAPNRPRANRDQGQ